MSEVPGQPPAGGLPGGTALEADESFASRQKNEDFRCWQWAGSWPGTGLTRRFCNLSHTSISQWPASGQPPKSLWPWIFSRLVWRNGVTCFFGGKIG